MGIRLKTFSHDQKVKELFDMFKLPSVNFTKGYQVKPRSELLGGSATHVRGLHAVNGLRRWTRKYLV